MTITPTLSDAPQVAVNDIGSEEDFLAAIDATIKYFNDGDIVEGTIVKVDRDEVLRAPDESGVAQEAAMLVPVLLGVPVPVAPARLPGLIRPGSAPGHPRR